MACMSTIIHRLLPYALSIVGLLVLAAIGILAESTPARRDMDFGSIEEIEQQGFSGFVAVSLLRESACRQVPEVPGVYLVIRPEWQPPSFLGSQHRGHFKGREPSVSIQELQQAWVTDGRYLHRQGMGDGDGRYLHRQGICTSPPAAQLRRFGDGEPAPHWGGRYVWQLADAADLLVCWKETPDEDPRQVEQRLIQKFRVRYGKRPFANLRN